MRRVPRLFAFVLVLAGLPGVVLAQTPPVPKPFPVPAGQQAPPASAPPVRTQAAQSLPADFSTPPNEAALGVALYPGAQFITAYDAGLGQRYYLFGTNAAFAEVVGYYKALLKDRGELVFEEPAVHQFDIGRFREDTMAFPPSVTVKDYTWGGMQGFLNPVPGAQPARFKTIIQVVPSPGPQPSQPRR